MERTLVIIVLITRLQVAYLMIPTYSLVVAQLLIMAP